MHKPIWKCIYFTLISVWSHARFYNLATLLIEFNLSYCTILTSRNSWGGGESQGASTSVWNPELWNFSLIEYWNSAITEFRNECQWVRQSLVSTQVVIYSKLCVWQNYKKPGTGSSEYCTSTESKLQLCEFYCTEHVTSVGQPIDLRNDQRTVAGMESIAYQCHTDDPNKNLKFCILRRSCSSLWNAEDCQLALLFYTVIDTLGFLCVPQVCSLVRRTSHCFKDTSQEWQASCPPFKINWLC